MIVQKPQTTIPAQKVEVLTAQQTALVAGGAKSSGGGGSSSGKR